MTTGLSRTYRLFDADGALLFIGVSSDPIVQQHRHACSGKPCVTRIAIAKFGEWKARAEALDEMDDAILAEKPLVNAIRVPESATPQVIATAE